MIIEKMLRFYIILSLTCILNAKADPIDDLLSVVNAEIPKILENHDEFSGSIIRSIYALRDTSSEIIFPGPWNATLTLSNILREAAKTLNQKECIARRQTDWKAKVPIINSDLYKCVYDFIKMGDEIRKKMQTAYEKGLKIKEDLLNVKKSCSTINIMSNECITRAVDLLNVSFKHLLKLVQIYNIEAQTIKSKILSSAMTCNARLLESVYKMSIDYQELLRKCLVDK